MHASMYVYIRIYIYTLSEGCEQSEGERERELAKGEI